MKVSLRRAILGVLVGCLALPGFASAAVTTSISQSTVQPGCQPKGLNAFPAPAAPAATLNGANVYTVVAIVGGAATTPCHTTTVNNTGTSPANSALIQWNATPGATAYKIYRNGQVLVFGPSVTSLTPTQVCPPGGTGTGPRCVFQDQGGPSTAADPQPAVAAGLDDAGSHPDLRITQRIDYGGDPATSADDPTAATDALKKNLLHFPAGLVANPTATAAQCKLSGPAPSLLGSLTLFGSNDPDEDTCPRSSQVGTVNALIRTASAPNGSPTAGDIYIGEPLGNETARLFVVLRPACSSGSFVAPGSATCTAVLGSANVEVDKSFLSARATVRTSDSGIDNETTSVVSGADEILSNTTTVRQRSTSPGTPNAVAGSTNIQVRSLVQTLFGFADQGTPEGDDDKSFIAMPTSCAAKALTADIETYVDLSNNPSSTPLQADNCVAVPFAPTLAVTLDASGGQQGNLGHPAFEARITQADNESATSSAEVILPEGLGTDLNRIGDACTQAEFASASGCPASSRVGSSTATTPVLPGTLEGPVYLVAQESGLPKLVVLLDGPLTLRLDGTIAFSGGTRLINRFEGLPEVPLSTFTIKLDGGEDGLLQNTRSVCDGLDAVDGTFNGYNGSIVTRSVPLEITGLGDSCESVTPYPIPGTTAKKPRVKVVMRGLGRGKPRIVVTIRRRGGLAKSRIRRVRFRLPKGVRFSVEAAERLLVKADGQRDTSFTAAERAFRNAKLRGGPARRTTINTRRSGIAATQTRQDKGSNQRLRFRFRIKVAGGRTFTIVKRVKPKS